jgi:Holliday junction resolvase RusA-like endonuclease
MKYKEIYHKTIIGKFYAKKNSSHSFWHKYSGKMIHTVDANYAGWEKDAKMQLGYNRGHIKKTLKKPIDYPIILKCHFYNYDKRKRDLSNYLEGIQDLLVEMEILKDDNYKIVIGHDGSRMFTDKENPRIEFWILEEVNEG